MPTKKQTGAIRVLFDSDTLVVECGKRRFETGRAEVAISARLADLIIKELARAKYNQERREARHAASERKRKNEALLDQARRALPDPACITLRTGNGEARRFFPCPLVVDGRRVGWKVDKLAGQTLVSGCAHAAADATTSIAIDDLSHAASDYSVAIPRVQPLNPGDGKYW